MAIRKSDRFPNRVPLAALALLLNLLAFPLFAQTGQPNLTLLKQFYDSQQFAMSVELGREMLGHGENLDSEKLSAIHHYLGLAFFNLGERDSARVHFLSLLSLEPQFALDPVEISPKIQTFFEDIRAELSANRVATPAFTRYVMTADPRPSAFWRSAVFPGWGQVFKQQKKRGVVLGLVVFGSAAATGVSWLQERDARDSYNAASDPLAIASAYDDYNHWYKIRRNMGLATALAWFWNVADAAWRGGNMPQMTVNNTGDGLRVGLSLNLP